MTTTGFWLTGPALSADQREVLAAALSDAITMRDPDVGYCRDCKASDERYCAEHAADERLCEAYRELGRELGIEVQM